VPQVRAGSFHASASLPQAARDSVQVSEYVRSSAAVRRLSICMRCAARRERRECAK